MAKTAATPAIPTVTVADAMTVRLNSWPPFPDDEIIAGNPNGHSGAVLYRSPDRRYSIGVWECPAAKFRVPYEGTEFGHVMKGRATITDLHTGEGREIRAGDDFYIAFGAEVIWEVHETFRKIYTMYETEWLEERFY